MKKPAFTVRMVLMLTALLLAGCQSPLVIEIAVPTRTPGQPTAEVPTQAAPTTAPLPTSTRPAPTATTAPTTPPEPTQPAQNAGMTITINPFNGGSTFIAPATVTVSGTADPVPFEKQMTYQVYDQQNQLVDQGVVMVSGEYGSAGTFSVDIPFKASQVGEYTIRVLDTSENDGSVLASADTHVILKSSAGEQMVITLDPLPNGYSYKVPVTIVVSGTVNVMPFEKTLAYQVYAPSGNLYSSGPITVQGEYGASGKFSHNLNFPATANGEYTIRVVNISPKDGAVTAAAQMVVNLSK